MTNKHGVPPEDVSTVTVEVERPKIKTERPVCVPESCDVKITVVTILNETGGVSSESMLRGVKTVTQKAPTSVTWRCTRCIVLREE